jgi:probable F420-dependent oxidoreductase
MTKLELGRIGISLNVSDDDTYLDEAAEIEELGYSTIWVPGGQLDSLDRIAELVRATTTIKVAPGIIPVDVYAADAVTALYADLEADAPGRFVVGLGGPQKPRPLKELNRYLDQLDASTPPVPASRRVLAALGPRKLELARDRSGGAIALLVTPDYTRDARAILGPDSTLVLDQFVVLDSDASRARETARGPLRFLSGVAGYRSSFERMGYSDEDIDDLSDRLVDDLVAWGDADAVAARVDEQFAAGADQVVLGVLTEGDQPGPIDVARQLASRLID